MCQHSFSGAVCPFQLVHGAQKNVRCAALLTTGEGQRPEDGGGDAQVQHSGEEPGRRTAGTERVVCFGETLMAEYRRSRTLEFRKMFQLQEGMKLQSNWGLVSHTAIAGKPAGTVLRTSLGLPMLIRRPSLEEFTLFMRRGPAIAYPKVIIIHNNNNN